MSFLITGHPRCRTAWLSALLAAHGAPCVHDALIRSADDIPEGWGISDPGFALHYPHLSTEWVNKNNATVVVITRDNARQAFEDEFGTVSDLAWERMEDNLTIFMNNVPQHELYTATELTDDEIVGEIITLCTKQEPSPQIISTFQQLQITQHLGVAKHRFNSKTGPSILGT